MSMLRSWILSIVACSLLLGMANSLLPEGSGKKMARFTGGLLLMIELLKPVKDIYLTIPSLDLDAYQQTISAIEVELKENWDEELADSIARKTSAYIESKASELGLSVRAEVETKTVDGVPMPECVTIYGEKNDVLARCIEQELGITGEKQTWIETEK